MFLKYVIFAKTLVKGYGVLWSDENVLELDRGSDCTALCGSVLNTTEFRFETAAAVGLSCVRPPR